jgi:hypothetical protein
MMRRVLLTITLVLMTFAPWLTAAGANACTSYLVPPGPVPAQLAGVVCLHAGVYPQTQLQLSAAAPATLMSAPGERAVLQATSAGGMWVRSPFITISHLTIDNGGLANAALSVSTSAHHFTLIDSEVRHGSYYGLDIWAPYSTLISDTLHDFQPDDRVPGNDSQCINVHGSASFGTLISSTIWSCWGDGIQFFNFLPNTAVTVRTTGWLIAGNAFRRGNLAYSENAIDVKGTLGMIIRDNDLAGYDNTGHLGTGQPAVVLHGNAQMVDFQHNTVRDSFQGLQISNGDWLSLTISGNTFTNLTGYAVDFAGARQAVVRNNTIQVAGEVIQVVNNGWVGGAFDHNLIIDAARPRLYSGARFSGVAIGPNGWVNTQPDFLGALGDVGQRGPGFGVFVAPTPTQTPTATATATATPSQTATASQTATGTATSTATDVPTETATVAVAPTLSGCWDLRHIPPSSIACP